AKPEAKSNTHSGEVAGTSEGQLKMTIGGEKEHSHTITDRTEITINGKPARLGDLRRGDAIEVSMGENNVALAVKATRQTNTATRQPSNQPARRSSNQREVTRQSEQGDQSRQSQKGEPFLGVALAPSRGGGVFIPDVTPNGPAAKAGIRGGDYILSIDGKEVSSPEELDNAIAELKPGSEVNIVTWRDRQEREVTAMIETRQTTVGFRPDPPQRSRADETQESADQPTAWLGVLLVEPEEGNDGVLIERVHPEGPAASAGIQPGDLLLSIDGRNATDVDGTSRMIAKMQPGAKAQLVVSRDGQRQTITVALTDRSEFFSAAEEDMPTEFDSGDMPEHFLMLEQHRHFAQQHQRIEELCQKLLIEVQELRKEVNALKNQ
ncbi:MAG TPA: PDZ domain-containing protein, partial [Planctomycetaceae bacterium]|nr:PDZ domain-containing protein [Planctomycetaceae bacterium]